MATSWNPLKGIKETKLSPQAHRLRSSIFTKLSRTFLAFYGNTKPLKELWYKLVIDANTLTLNFERQARYQKKIRQAQKNTYHGIFGMPLKIALGFFQIAYTLVFAIPYTLHGLSVSLLGSRNLLRIIGGLLISLVSAPLVCALLLLHAAINTAATLLWLPIKAVLSTTMTCLLSFIPMFIELYTLPEALKSKRSFQSLNVQKPEQIIDDTFEPSELNHEKTMSQLWAQREQITQFRMNHGNDNNITNDMDKPHIAFYHTSKTPGEDDPDFILTAEDISKNLAGFRALLHLNMFNMLGKQEKPFKGCPKKESHQPFVQARRQPARPINWLKNHGVEINIYDEIDLNDALPKGNPGN